MLVNAIQEWGTEVGTGDAVTGLGAGFRMFLCLKFTECLVSVLVSSSLRLLLK